MTSMTMPTGAEITYSYTEGTSAYSYGWWITGRTTPDGSWAYNSSTVTMPSGDYTVYTFTQNGGPWLTEEQSYDSSSNLMSTTTACYSFVTLTSGTCSYSGTFGSPLNVHKTAQTTTLPIPGGSVSTTAVYTWDTNNYGNLTKLQEWNFGSSLSGNADRTTNIAYLNGSSYISANILNRLTSVTVQDSGSNTVAQTLYCYDYSGGCGGSSFGSATGTPNHDDTNYPTTNTVRGDSTQVQRLVSGSTYLTTSTTYDMTGQPTSSTDSKGNTTTLSYSDNYFDDNTNNSSAPSTHSTSTPTNAYPTSITPPASSSAISLGYIYGTGQLAKITDPNSNISYFQFYDYLSRATATALAFPNGPWTLTVYDVSSSKATGVENYTGISSALSTLSSCSSCRHDATIFPTNGLPHPISTRLVNDPDGETFVDTTYDSDGRVSTVTNPYRGTPPGNVTTLNYDGLDRVYKVEHPDGQYAYSYSGGAVTSGLGGQTSQLCSASTYGHGYPTLMIDEVQNKRQTWTDAFGRVIETDEPDSTGVLNKKTCYAYDMNNNLTGVLAADGSQTRSYGFDMLSRLTSKTDPETKSNTWNYYYTTSGSSLCSGDPSAVCRRTDTGRGITTTYSYDNMNRLTGMSYSDSTPTVAYSYDSTSCLSLSGCSNLGRRTGMSDGSGSTAWAYDAVGNILRESRTIISVNKTISYTYNLDGTIATIVYPGGRTVTYTSGNAERQTAAQDNGNSIYYATSATYAPQGALSSVQNGSSLNSIIFYNTRLELCRISVKNGSGSAPTTCADSTAGNVLDLSFSYGQTSFYGSGNSFNNGNIVTQSNNVSGASGRTQYYTYDPLNRVLTAQSAATSTSDCWGQGFGTYNATSPTLPLADDALNNQLLVTSTKCSSPAPSWSVNGYNQITTSPYTYSSGGGNTEDTNYYTYTYDPENRLVSANVGGGTYYCYLYDGNGMRAAKSTSSSSSCGSLSTNELYWRDVAGDTIAETDGSGSTSDSAYNEYALFGGSRIAQSNPYSGNVFYYFADQLGSTRVVTNASGSPCYEADFLPYGYEKTPYSFTNSCSTNYKFTGYERDTETGNDYAMARYYSQTEERFLSPDPLSGDITDPQTLNKYTYARNNPVNLTDPTGLTSETGVCLSENGLGSCGNEQCLEDPTCGYIPVGDPEGNNGPEDPVYHPPNVGSNTNPPAGDSTPGDTWTWGCEHLGMPCGMQFPVPGGDCPFGISDCTGIILNATDGQGESTWSNFMRWLRSLPWAGTVLIPIPGTEGTLSVMIPAAYIPPSNASSGGARIGCLGLGLAATTPTNKVVSGGILMAGNVTKARSILSGWGWNFSGQATPFMGVQAVVNKSGAMGGPTVATDSGASAGYGWSHCGNL